MRLDITDIAICAGTLAISLTAYWLADTLAIWLYPLALDSALPLSLLLLW